MSLIDIQHFRLKNEDDAFAFDNLIASNANVVVVDQIWDQLTDLVKILFIGQLHSESDITCAIENHIGSSTQQEYGVWIYYPWKNVIVHLLDEEEFLIVKTNRNKDKITEQEQKFLRTKKIGVIGLSVGHSAATTIALEGIAGEIRLADFDTLDLSNCNRIKTSITNIGLPKFVITAREILEIDPFIKITCFPKGITEENIDAFITANGVLDAIVEECDSVSIKILARTKARQYKIPLIMEMSDRGMIDIERYDLDCDYPMFHGALAAYDFNEKSANSMVGNEKLQLMYDMVGGANISTQLKNALPKIGVSLLTYPQLASAVMLGGGIATDVLRRILLQQLEKSGRFYVDLDQILN